MKGNNETSKEVKSNSKVSTLATLIERLGFPSICLIAMFFFFFNFYTDYRKDSIAREEDNAKREERLVDRINSFDASLEKFSKTLEKIDKRIEAIEEKLNK